MHTPFQLVSVSRRSCLLSSSRMGPFPSAHTAPEATCHGCDLGAIVPCLASPHSLSATFPPFSQFSTEQLKWHLHNTNFARFRDQMGDRKQVTWHCKETVSQMQDVGPSTWWVTWCLQPMNGIKRGRQEETVVEWKKGRTCGPCVAPESSRQPYTDVSEKIREVWLWKGY